MYADRLPPHDIEAEEAVIGSLLIDGDAMYQIAEIVSTEDFYEQRARWCYEACVALFQRQEAINQITLAHELSRVAHLEEVGGSAFLSHLVAAVPTSLHIQYYARIVAKSSVLRKLIRAAGEISAIGYEEAADIEASLDKAENILYGVRANRERKDFVHISNILEDYLEDGGISGTSSMDASVGPIPTGFTDLDRLLGGMQRSDMIVLAARPSVGKSTLVLNMVRHAAGLGYTSAFFSLEMSREQLALRLLSSEAAVDSHRLRLGLVTETEERKLLEGIGALSELPIYIDDTPLLSISEMSSRSRRLNLEQGIDLVVVDHIQLARGTTRTDNRVQEVSEITRSLKGLARDLNVPLIAVSQLRRAVEDRTGHRPQLSDLRESGSIEQDADVVAFIYREDMYYSEDEWDARFTGRPYPKNIAELILAKHRHGPIDTVNLFFREKLSRFENLASSDGVGTHSSMLGELA
jgi:replicative DNA helicase